jgi:AAA domain, putative AbiEii toxin, Type IV TA system/AAA domain
MFVREVRITGVKGFEPGTRDVKLNLERPDSSYAGWTVVAGRNGAGKSTFLQAIALAVAGPAAARSLRPSFQGWINESISEASIAVRLTYNDKFDKFGLGGFPPADFWAGLKWARDPAAHDSLRRSSEPLVAQYRPTGPKQSALRGPWFENPRGWFLSGYGPFGRLSKASSEAQRIMLGTTRLVQLATLFREDASLEECVQWLQQVNFQKLEGKPGAEELESSVIGLMNDGLMPDGVRVDRVDSQGLWVSGLHVEPLPLEEMSDGYRTVAALVADICRLMYETFGEFQIERAADGSVLVPYEGVVLIDEIDVHLHVSWQQRIGFWLKKRFPNVQFIVSTHSPFICQAADENGLIRLPAPGEVRDAEILRGQLFRRIIHGTADDATMSELFGLEYSHSLESESLRKRLASLEAKQIRGEANEIEQLELLDLANELAEPSASIVGQISRELSPS